MESKSVMDTMLVSRVRILYIRSLLTRSPELQSIKVSPVERFLEKGNTGRSRSSSRGSSPGRPHWIPFKYDKFVSHYHPDTTTFKKKPPMHTGIQAFEIMAIGAVGNNLITYVFNDMQFPLSKAANIVANFVGAVFLLSLLGGFLSDSCLGSFWAMPFFGFVELSGFILLSVQAHLPQLRPSPCNMLLTGKQCMEATGIKAIIFFIALYLLAFGPFGIITRARIILQEAPKKVKWVRAFYDDFLAFNKDQEPLILMLEKVDYVEGFMVLIWCQELSPNKGTTIWCFQPRGQVGSEGGWDDTITTTPSNFSSKSSPDLSNNLSIVL